MATLRRFFILARLGRYEEAIDSINLALEAGTIDEQGLLCKATVLELMGRLAEAQLAYNDVLSINSKSQQSYVGRAIVFRKLNRFKEAMEDVDRAIEVAPDFAEAFE